MAPDRAAELDELMCHRAFAIAVYAAACRHARQMALGPPVSCSSARTRRAKVYAVVDRDGGNRTVQVVASASTCRAGVAVPRLRYALRRRGETGSCAPRRRPRSGASAEGRGRHRAYPSDAHHGWKVHRVRAGRPALRAGRRAVQYLYAPGPLHATITRLDLAGGRPEVMARGVRNSVRFDFDPASGDLWFTDKGRDWLGDDQPPDE